MANGEGVSPNYVKWSDNVKLIITVFCIAVAISLGAINLHSQAPHKDAVNHREFDRLRATVDTGFQKVDNNFSVIDEKLDNITEKLHEIKR